ncbi:MAG: rRNA maturation RNase YbeY [Deltaproteobacteria bacterium]|nr:rRNA maturation RNase YbeY [Deltaproteobacteria bacterium]
MTDAELSIAVVDDAAMRRLNLEWRGIDRTTDVLSFSQLEGDQPRAPGRRGPGGGRSLLLGDVVLSAPTARRQARRYRHPLPAEVDRLLVHAVLHLLGYDHVGSRRRALAMRRAERRLLRRLRADGQR